MPLRKEQPPLHRAASASAYDGDFRRPTDSARGYSSQRNRSRDYMPDSRNEDPRRSMQSLRRYDDRDLQRRSFDDRRGASFDDRRPRQPVQRYMEEPRRQVQTSSRGGRSGGPDDFEQRERDRERQARMRGKQRQRPPQPATTLDYAQGIPSPPVDVPPPPLEAQSWDYLRAGNVRNIQQPPRYDDQGYSADDKLAREAARVKRKPAPAYVPSPVGSRQPSQMGGLRERASAPNVMATPPRVRAEPTPVGYRAVIPQEIVGQSPVRSSMELPRANGALASPLPIHSPLGRHQDLPARGGADDIFGSPTLNRPPLPRYQSGSGRIRAGDDRPEEQGGLVHGADSPVIRPKTPPGLSPVKQSLDLPRQPRREGSETSIHRALALPSGPSKAEKVTRSRRTSDAHPAPVAVKPSKPVEEPTVTSPSSALASLPSEEPITSDSGAAPKVGFASRQRHKSGSEGLLFGFSTAVSDKPVRSRSKVPGKDDPKVNKFSSKPMGRTGSGSQSRDRLAVPDVTSDEAGSSGDNAPSSALTKQSNASKSSVARSVNFKGGNELAVPVEAVSSSRRDSIASPPVAPLASLNIIDEDSPQINERKSSKLPPALPGLAPEPAMPTKRAYERKPKAPEPARPVQAKKKEEEPVVEVAEPKERPRSKLFGLFGGGGPKEDKPKREVLPDGRVVVVAAPASPKVDKAAKKDSAKKDKPKDIVAPAFVSKGRSLPVESPSEEEPLSATDDDGPRAPPVAKSASAASTLRANETTRAPLNLQTVGLGRFSTMRQTSATSVSESDVSSANGTPLLSDFSDSRPTASGSSNARTDVGSATERERKAKSSLWPMSFSSMGRGSKKTGSTSSLPPQIETKRVMKRVPVERDSRDISAGQASIAPSVVTSDEVPNALKLPGMTAMSPISPRDANKVDRDLEDRPSRPPSRAMTDTTAEDHFTDVDSEISDAEEDARSEGGQTARRPGSGTQTPVAPAARSQVDVTRPSEDTPRPISGYLPASVSGLLGWMTGSSPTINRQSVDTARPAIDTGADDDDEEEEADRTVVRRETELVTSESDSEVQPSTPPEVNARPATPKPTAALAAPITTAMPARPVRQESSIASEVEDEEEAPAHREPSEPSDPPPSFAAAIAAGARYRPWGNHSRSGSGRRPRHQRRRSRSSVSSNSSAERRRRRRRAEAATRTTAARPASPTRAASPVAAKKAKKGGLLAAFRKRPMAKEDTKGKGVATPSSSPVVEAAPATPTSPRPTESTSPPASERPKRFSFLNKKRPDVTATSPTSPKPSQTGDSEAIESSGASSRQAPAPAQPERPKTPSRMSLLVNDTLHRSLSTALAAVDKLSGVDGDLKGSQPAPADGSKRRVTFSHAEDAAAAKEDEAEAAKQKKPLGALLYGKVTVQNDEIKRMRNEGAYWQNAPTRSALKNPSSASLPRAGPSTSGGARSSASLPASPRTNGPPSPQLVRSGSRTTQGTQRDYRPLAPALPASNYGGKPKSTKKPSEDKTSAPSSLAVGKGGPSFMGRTASYIGLGGKGKASDNSPEVTSSA